AELIVKMGPAGQACLADVADGLALADPAALLELRCEARKVTVERRRVVAVLHDDAVAVATLDAAEDDLAVARGLDRRSGRCGVVDAAMRAHRAQARMLARVAEARADPREIHWSSYERLLERPSVRTVVAGAAVLTDEAEREVALAGGFE